jgi:hypothetical protein
LIEFAEGPKGVLRSPSIAVHLKVVKSEAEHESLVTTQTRIMKLKTNSASTSSLWLKQLNFQLFSPLLGITFCLLVVKLLIIRL